ncbi:MAG: hypothetical protein ACOYNF_12470 [Rhodoferax sp.]
MSPNVKTLIDQIDSQLAQFSEALLNSRPDALMATSAALRATLVDFSRQPRQVMAEYRCDPVLRARIHKIAAVLASRRENLVRQSVIVERSLAALMPAAKAQTYAPPSGGYSRQPYGSAGIRSGEFQATSA